MRAQIVPYSSVVGSSIMILNDRGNVVSVLSVLIQTGKAEEHREKSEGMAQLIAELLNSQSKEKDLPQLLKFYENKSPNHYLFIEGDRVKARGRFFSGQEAVDAAEELYPDATVGVIVGKQKHDTITAPINGVEQMYANLKLPERNQS